MINKRFFFGVLLSLHLSAAAALAEKEILIKYFDLAEGRIAFSYELNGSRKIHVLDFATLEAKPLPDQEGNNDSPRFSPDGSKIAFVSDRTKNKDIFVMNADGSEVKQLTDSATEDEDPDWSPDGKQIVFSSPRSGEGTDIYLMDADGGNPTALMKSTKQNTNPRWNPNGESIVFMTNEYWPGTDLLLYDRASKKITILTTGYISSLQPAWDRNGSLFAYVYGPADDPDIWTQKLGGGGKGDALVTRTGKDLSPEWIDNGKSLLFLGETEPGNGHYEIFLFNRDEKGSLQITESEGVIRGLSWHPTSPNKKTPKPPVKQEDGPPISEPPERASVTTTPASPDASPAAKQP